MTWLRETLDRVPLTAPSDRTRQQAVIDMSDSAQGMFRLVTGGWPDQRLTPLGRVVLEEWESLRATEDDIIDETIRNIVLFRAVVDGEPQQRRAYLDMASRWRRLVALQPLDYWTQDVLTMTLPAYLDEEDSRGFNPFQAFIGISDGNLGSRADWRAWAQSDWPGRGRLTGLLKYIEDGHRRLGSEAFRRAMEAVHVAATEPRRFPALLNDWGIPA